MNDAPSLNTRAILLLTAPLIIGRERRPAPKPLGIAEYNRLARRLQELQLEPADLLGTDVRMLLRECRLNLEPDRLVRLLERGFLLSQALERWSMRALWVTSRADAEYPRRLKRRLREAAPPVLYGCGKREDLNMGGLAVVGSRNVDDALISYTEGVGRLASEAQRTVVSGGARGVDQAAMRGALNAGGTVVCVLADSLERAATRREYRGALMDGRLVLTCPYDPAAGFLVGHAMQRNKLIYSLADAALVVSAEFERGGTWAGAVEHLDRHRFVSVYVRSTGEMGRGLEALLERGAHRWVNPDSPEALDLLLPTHPTEVPTPESVTQLRELQIAQNTEDDAQPVEAATPTARIEAPREAGLRVAANLLASVSELLLRYLEEPKTEDEVVSTFEVQKYQARRWLKRLVADGAIEKLSRPTRYRAVGGLNAELPLGSVEGLSPAEQLFASVRKLLLPHLDEPKTVEDVARAFDVQKNQAQGWLTRLMAEGAAMRLPGARYRTADEHSNLLLPLADLNDTLSQGSRIA